MNRVRQTAVAALAGLALLAQGLSMAWASAHDAVPAEPAAAEAAMPCHGGDAGDQAGTPASDACCNAGCPFACGGAPLPALLPPLAMAAPDHVFAAAPVPALRPSHALTPFRPPAR